MTRYLFAVYLKTGAKLELGFEVEDITGLQQALHKGDADTEIVVRDGHNTLGVRYAAIDAYLLTKQASSQASEQT